MDRDTHLFVLFFFPPSYDDFISATVIRSHEFSKSFITPFPHFSNTNTLPRTQLLLQTTQSTAVKRTRNTNLNLNEQSGAVFRVDSIAWRLQRIIRLVCINSQVAFKIYLYVHIYTYISRTLVVLPAYIRLTPPPPHPITCSLFCTFCSVISRNNCARTQTETDKMMEISRSFVSRKLTVYKSSPT